MAGKTSVPGSDRAQDGLTSLVRTGEDRTEIRLLSDTAKPDYASAACLLPQLQKEMSAGKGAEG